MNGTEAVTFSSILAAEQPAAGGGFMNYILFAVFAVLMIVMFRKQRKNKAAAQEKRSKLAPGVDVMTNFGLFGHVKAIDPEDNKISLEVAPGVVLQVHSQVVAKIIEPENGSLQVVGASVPDDVSSLTKDLDKDSSASETAEETLARLNKENKNDN